MTKEQLERLKAINRRIGFINERLVPLFIHCVILWTAVEGYYRISRHISSDYPVLQWAVFAFFAISGLVFLTSIRVSYKSSFRDKESHGGEVA